MWEIQWSALRASDSRGQGWGPGLCMVNWKVKASTVSAAGWLLLHHHPRESSGYVTLTKCQSSSRALLRVEGNCLCVPTWSSAFCFRPSSCLCAGIGLTTCWLYLQTQRINVFLSETTGKGECGSEIVSMVLLISLLPDFFWSPIPGPPSHSQIHCEQLLAPWSDGPPCQLSDVTHQSSIFPANLYRSNFIFPGLWL